MAHVAARWERFTGRSVGSGQCVALVQQATGAPLTKHWSRGARVQDQPDLAPGTAIATFDANGRYGNHVDGRSHAALFLRHEERGAILVFDQWRGRVAGERSIREKFGTPPAADDAGKYHVIETA